MLTEWPDSNRKEVGMRYLILLAIIVCLGCASPQQTIYRHGILYAKKGTASDTVVMSLHLIETTERPDDWPLD